MKKKKKDFLTPTPLITVEKTTYVKTKKEKKYICAYCVSDIH